MTDDQFGIKMLYPTVAGGDTWFMTGDPNNDPRFNIGGSVNKMISRPFNMWEPDDHTKVRLFVFPVGGYTQPDGACDMDFADTIAKGYAGSKQGWGDTETTVYYLVTAVDDDSDHLHLGGPTSEHPGNSTPCCMGFSYKSFVSVDDPVHVFFGKEMYHVTNDDLDPKILKNSLGSKYNLSVMDLPSRSDINVFHGIFGVKYIVRLNQGAEKKFVTLEQWMNISGDKQTWEKVNEITDTGGWGTEGATCNGDPDQIGNWRADRMRIRWDQGSHTHIQIGYVSVRQVTFESGSNPFPGPIGGTQFVRTIDVKYHLGILPAGTCGAFEVNPFTEFYNVEGNDTESNLHQKRYRVGVIANLPASKCIGKKPRRVTLRLKKTELVGTLPDEDISVKLRRLSDDTELINFELFDIEGIPATGPLKPSMLTNVKRNYTFQNTTHNYAWQLNDIMSVEYSGNTTDIVNEIDVFRDDTGPFDGGNTALIRYDKLDTDGVTPIGWSAVDVGKDLAWIIYD